MIDNQNCLTNDRTEITVKLTTSGRYVWSITYVCPTVMALEATQKIKTIDNQLRNQYPSHAIIGSGRVANFSEEL